MQVCIAPFHFPAVSSRHEQAASGRHANARRSTILESAKVTHLADYLVGRLTSLEYAIRQSITVREDQEDAAAPEQLEEAASCGVHVERDMSKGDLLSAVQTLARATRVRQATAPGQSHD